MTILGVRWSGTPNTFGPAYSAGASLAADSNTSETNRLRTQGYLQGLEHTNALHDAQRDYYGVKTKGEQQGIDGRNQAAEAAGVIAGYNATHPSQGTSNAAPAGAAPVPVELPPEVLAATRNYARGTALTATNANDLASGTGKVFGATGALFGPQDSTTQRRNSMLYTGTAPNENTVLGPWDTAGTDEKIRAEAAKPHFFEDGTSVAVPNPNHPSGYDRQTLGNVDKNPNFFGGNSDQSRALSAVNQIAQKFNRGEKLSEDEKNAYDLFYSKAFPRDWTKVNIDGNEYDVDRNEAYRRNFPTIDQVRGIQPQRPQLSNPNDPRSPVIIQPQQPDQYFDDPSKSPIVSRNAPLPIGADGRPVQPSTPQDPSAPMTAPPPGSFYTGPTRRNPTESSDKAKMYAGSMLIAEQTLANTKLPAEAPGILDELFNAPNKSAYVTIMAKAKSNPATQAYFQAAESFVLSYLRQISGATIGDPEYVRYFNNLIGTGKDLPATMAQKKAQRDELLTRTAATGFGEGSSEFKTIVENLKLINQGKKVYNFDGPNTQQQSSQPTAPGAGGRMRLNPQTGEYEAVQ